MSEVLIDGVAYVPKQEPKEEPKKAPEPVKQDIREYCKEHRVWAAMDEGNNFGWYIYRDRPDKKNTSYQGGRMDGSATREARKSCTFPDIPWDKSLIAPDGSMPLMDKQEPKKPEAGKWYTYTAGPERGVGQCKEIYYYTARYLIYFPEWVSGHNGRGRYTGGHCWWCDASELVEAPAPLPARGDPIFVWDDDTPDTIPAHMEYFHHADENGVADCAWERLNKPGCYWDHYRPFDAALVGVARKDWRQ